MGSCLPGVSWAQWLVTQCDPLGTLNQTVLPRIIGTRGPLPLLTGVSVRRIFFQTEGFVSKDPAETEAGASFKKQVRVGGKLCPR